MAEENQEVESEMSEAELAEKLSQLVGTTPTSEERQNVHTFLHNVAVADDTTKTGYLTDEEVGLPKLPVRTYKELALFCSGVANMDYYSDYFLKKAEIISSTSLSKDAKLISLAVLQKRQVEDVTRAPMKENKGWFKKKQPTQPTLT